MASRNQAVAVVPVAHRLRVFQGVEVVGAATIAPVGAYDESFERDEAERRTASRHRTVVTCSGSAQAESRSASVSSERRFTHRAPAGGGKMRGRHRS